MDIFKIVIQRNLKVQTKIKDISDKNLKLSLNFQSKIGHDTFFQNVILNEILNLMNIIIVDMDVELKLEINRKKIFRK